MTDNALRHNIPPELYAQLEEWAISQQFPSTESYILHFLDKYRMSDQPSHVTREEASDD